VWRKGRKKNYPLPAAGCAKRVSACFRFCRAERRRAYCAAKLWAAAALAGLRENCGGALQGRITAPIFAPASAEKPPFRGLFEKNAKKVWRFEKAVLSLQPLWKKSGQARLGR